MDYKTRLIDRERVGPDVLIIHVEKPEGFKYLAGQFCFIVVPDIGLHDDRGLRRAFSVASSPLEKELLFVTKTSDSAFKRTIVGLSPWRSITLETPLGSLILPENTETPLLFLAGGIGITPFRSMMRYAADADTGHKITLFYSSQRPAETPFLAELQQLPKQCPDMAVTITMTRAGEKDWAGPTGRISPEMIKNGCAAWESSIYYVVGPPAMAMGMKEMLQGMGVTPAQIKMELFTGY